MRSKGICMERNVKKDLKRAGKGILAVCIPVWIFYLFEWYTHNPFLDIRVDIQFMNILFFELVMVILYSLIGRLHVALVLETLVFMVYGLINYYVLSFRSQPIQPWDFFSIGTAVSVAGNFSYRLDSHAAAALTGFVLLIPVELFFCQNRLKHTVLQFYRGPLRSWAFRVPAAAAAVTGLVCFVSLLHNEEFVQEEIRMYDKLFTPTVMSERDGTAVAFLLELQYIDVDRPEGYEREAAEAFFHTGAEIPPAAAENGYPNIIVIMDEAFSDLSVLGEFETSEDYMPFLHRMQEGADNTVTGTLHVSVKGGNTANTEFEFLTGNTMAFLPYGSVPYQQYVDEEQPALAAYLSDLGYTTRAAHPYYASGWERETVYPLLGFSEADFLDSFNGAKKLRSYVSDAAAFDYIIQCYEEKEEGEPLFFFEVTMQNHSGYSEEYANFTPAISAQDCKSASLNCYLSLIRETDRALEELITYFSRQEEDTVILFFGDHQPADYVVEPLLRTMGKSGDTLTEEEQAQRYKVPFLIWANYDIEEAQRVELSANYLGGYMLKTAGLTLPVYQQYLEKLRAEVPVLSERTMYTKDGYAGSPDAYEGELLQDYQRLQYYLLFDRE